MLRVTPFLGRSALLGWILLDVEGGVLIGGEVF